MTVLSPTQIVGMALPALAPSSSGPVGGSNIGTYAGTDWQYSRTAKVAKTKQERRNALAKARQAVEARGETKQQRLERAASARDTGSELERRATRNTVAKAAAALVDVPMDSDFNTAEFRAIREKLRQRYPGAKLSDMLAQAAGLEKMLMDDPVQAREALIAAYARVKPAAEFVAPTRSKGLRGSLQRARQDQEDAQDLKDWVALYGKRLPQIMAELEVTDSSLRANAPDASAKLAARFGAPAIASEVPAYLVRMEQKAQQKALQQMYDNRVKGIQLAIQHGHLPGDEDTLEELAEVLKLPQFQWDHSDMLGSLQRAAKIATHPDHKRISPRKGGKSGRSGRDAGSLSINGGPGAGQGGRASSKERGTGTFRDSVARVRAAM
jgi:hypothetical protein